MSMFGQLFKFIFGGKSSAGYGTRVVLDRQAVSSKWMEIEELVKLGGPSRFKTAIMEADKLLDYVLRGKGFKGETMGERLKSAQGRVDRATLDAAWSAHKFRNRIAHEIDADVMHFQVKREIENFRKVLRDMGVM